MRQSGLSRLAAPVLALAVLAALAPLPAFGSTDTPNVQVIVRATQGADAAAAVEAIGGTVVTDLDIIGGFTASIPADMVDDLAAHPATVSVSIDASVTLMDDAGWDDSSSNLDDSETAQLNATAASLTDAYDRLQTFLTDDPKLRKDLEKAASDFQGEVDKSEAKYQERLLDAADRLDQELTKRAAELTEAIDKASSDLDKALEGADSPSKEAEARAKYAEAVDKAELKAADEVAKAESEFDAQVAKATADRSKDIDEATERYARQLNEVERDYLKATQARAKVHAELRKILDSSLASFMTTGGSALPMSLVVHETAATAFWAEGYDGSGIDVAVIDSGITPVDGLATSDKIVNGPDLSFDSQEPSLAYLDLYGHGTHMAGIIAGRDAGADTGGLTETNGFTGMAPGARLVNIKVADATGTVDVSQVIAAIDWVVQHRNDNGLNIRVLNLSFGTDSAQPYELDPLAFAVEQAWNHGIVVVVATGNDGIGSPVRNPAFDPFVLAVGAAKSDGRSDTDDEVASFTSCSKDRAVDLIAPGRSIVSLRVPGSMADEEHHGASVDDRFFKGSGTSQAAAVVSGAVALVLQQRPYLNPDQVKALLMDSAAPAKGDAECRGAGFLDLGKAVTTPSRMASAAVQGHAASSGLGSLEAARSSTPVGAPGAELEGEIDIFGNAWDPVAWATASASGAAWSGGDWNGASWSGASWSGASWSGASWSGASWSGASWSGASWSGASWSGASWSGASWSGASWSTGSWQDSGTD